MQRPHLTLFLIAMAETALPTIANASPPADMPLVDGATVYRQTCARCHNYRMPNEFTPEAWEVILQHMKVRAGLPQRDIDALVRWFIPDTSQADSTWMDRASELFPEEPLIAAQCVRCHDPDRIATAVAAGWTRDQWTTTLRRMRTYGSPLTSADETTLVDALWQTPAPSSPLEAP